MEKYHLGGCRYNGMPGEKVLAQNRILQKYAKVPVFIACNPETGGSGVCSDGTFVSSQVKLGATGKPEYAQAMGRVSGAQIAATGCNMAFAPVMDITYNWECEEILTRAYSNDPEKVASMGYAYMQGLFETEGVASCAKHFPGNGQDYRDAHLSNNVNHFGLEKWMATYGKVYGLFETEGVASCAKHFPGNGQDYRDAHLSNNVNHFGLEKWMATYGKVYKTLIDGGLQAIMGGHILMPEYMKELHPDITPEQLRPATLCPEIMTDLLRNKLGFNGMVVTDASPAAQ